MGAIGVSWHVDQVRDTMKRKCMQDKTQFSALPALCTSEGVLGLPSRSRGCLLDPHFISSCRYDCSERGPFGLLSLGLESKWIIIFIRLLGYVGFEKGSFLFWNGYLSSFWWNYPVYVQNYFQNLHSEPTIRTRCEKPTNANQTHTLLYEFSYRIISYPKPSWKQCGAVKPG